MAIHTQPVFLLGCGGVGKALLRQILAGRELHRSRNQLKLSVVGVSDSTGLLLNARGLRDDALNKALENKSRSGQLSQVQRSVTPALLSELPANTIVVDTTATASTVPTLLKAKKLKMGVVTANKLPVAGALRWWDVIADRRSRWETTCGAALPVISTLNTLLDSGDEVHRIEGTLSGTLGFICAQLEAGVKFGEAVRDAKRRGYTEPDPRQDLGGLDVARKALILARMLGYRLEMDDVKVESLYPAHMNVMSVDDFMRDVDSLNEPMLRRVRDLTRDNHKMRYAAVVENGRLKVGLVAAAPESKLGMSRASDSVVIFHTKYFTDNPVTISGRGAGQEVTASGVLGDIVSLSQ
jgi:homoserine dehydrogenase